MRRKKKIHSISLSDLRIDDTNNNNIHHKNSRKPSRSRRFFQKAVAKIKVPHRQHSNIERRLEISAPIIATSAQVPIHNPGNQRDSLPSSVGSGSDSINDDRQQTDVENEEVHEQRNMKQFDEQLHETDLSQKMSPMTTETILDRILSRNLRSITFCDLCSKFMEPVERLELIDSVIHQACFKCSHCGTPLLNRSAICEDKVWFCAPQCVYNLIGGDSKCIKTS